MILLSCKNKVVNIFISDMLNIKAILKLKKKNKNKASNKTFNYHAIFNCFGTSLET
uniref:Uncharacterized protein n=1 Tax=Helianthus annuus TaxID=4232 RepID=A0A251U0P9_HELAN